MSILRYYKRRQSTTVVLHPSHLNLSPLRELFLITPQSDDIFLKLFSLPDFRLQFYLLFLCQMYPLDLLLPGTTDSYFRGHSTGNPNWMKPEDIASARERTAVAELANSGKRVNLRWKGGNSLLPSHGLVRFDVHFAGIRPEDCRLHVVYIGE
ncbi:MAG: hypothetical protein ACE5PV_14460 [Candidatus Poribacteria bacterium]